MSAARCPIECYPIAVYPDVKPYNKTCVELVLGRRVSEHFAARKRLGEWQLDHMPSGFMVPASYRATLTMAMRLARKMERIADFSRMDSDHLTDAEIVAVRRALGEPVRRGTGAPWNGRRPA